MPSFGGQSEEEPAPGGPCFHCCSSAWPAWAKLTLFLQVKSPPLEPPKLRSEGGGCCHSQGLCL